MSIHDAEAMARTLLEGGWTQDEWPPDWEPELEKDPELRKQIGEWVGALLVEAYLNEYRLNSWEVEAAAELEKPGEAYSIPQHLRGELTQLQEQIEASRKVALEMYRGGDLNPDAEISTELSGQVGADVLQALRDMAQAKVQDALSGFTGSEWIVDGCGAFRHLNERFYDLAEPFRVDSETARAKLVGDAPPIRKWLTKQGWRAVLPAFLAELKRRAALDDRGRGRMMAGEPVMVVPALRPNYKQPAPILSIAAPDRYWREQGYTGVEVQAPQMDVWEWRALHGVLRIYSSPYERGGEWSEGWREVDFQTWCEAVGADPRRSKEVRSAVDAVVRLKSREILFNSKAQDGGGTVSKISILQGVAFDYVREDAGAAQRVLEGEGWTGQAPKAVRVQLSSPMRKMGGLWFPAEKDVAIRGAAQEIRGRQMPIDFQLRNELYRTRQTAQGYSYVDRDSFMRTQLGSETFEKYQSERRYGDKILRPYLVAVSVLEKAGVVLEWTKDYPTANGLRDRFKVVNPVNRNREIPAPKNHA